MIYNPTTPGTRRAWNDLGEWLAVWRELSSRPAASATYRAQHEHLALLTPSIVATWRTEYELEDADAIVRAELPPKGQRAGHPLVAVIDALDREITRARKPHYNAPRSRENKPIPGSGMASFPVEWTNPVVPLADAVRREGWHEKPLGQRPWMLPYAIARHPEMVAPLACMAALPRLPQVKGREWRYDGSDRIPRIVLVKPREKILPLTAEVHYTWQHVPRPWGYAWAGGASGGFATIEEAAAGLLSALGVARSVPVVAATPPAPPPQIMWRLVGPHVTGAAAQIYVKEGNARRAGANVQSPVDLEKVYARVPLGGGVPQVVEVIERSILHRGSRGVVGTVSSVEVRFQRIDEWHDTSMTIVATVPDRWLQQSKGAKIAWVAERWSEIMAKVQPYRVPPPASERPAYRYGDEDDEDDYDPSDFPEPGLGWYDPARMATLDTFEMELHAEQGPGPHEVTITLNWSHR